LRGGAGLRVESRILTIRKWKKSGAFFDRFPTDSKS